MARFGGVYTETLEETYYLKLLPLGRTTSHYPVRLVLVDREGRWIQDLLTFSPSNPGTDSPRIRCSREKLGDSFVSEHGDIVDIYAGYMKVTTE